MRYEKNGRELKIYLALSQGEIKENDISFCSLNHSKDLLKENQDYSDNPDLIITIGITTLNALANFFEENQKIFYKVHILNIDNQPANERFGEINLVEPNSSSIAEIATDLIKTVDDCIFDKNITTSLLAGIIISSKNFRDLKTNLKTFKTASFLIENGANYQRIIQHLYKEKEVSQIKLLGRILEKLNFNKEKELYLIPLKEKDFQESGTKPKDLGNIIEELKFNPGILPNFNRVFPLLVLFETHSSPSCVRGIFYSKNLNSIDNIIKNFQGTQKGNWVLFTIKEKGLEKAEQKVLQLLE
jgi:nanoRNase/pAp phosphatase (c-di-AMP/oligoRNAs hydrolase)